MERVDSDRGKLRPAFENASEGWVPAPPCEYPEKRRVARKKELSAAKADKVFDSQPGRKKDLLERALFDGVMAGNDEYP